MLGKLLISALLFLYMYIRAAQCGTLVDRAIKSLSARQKVSLLEQNGAQFVIIAVYTRKGFFSFYFFKTQIFQTSNLGLNYNILGGSHRR